MAVSLGALKPSRGFVFRCKNVSDKAVAGSNGDAKFLVIDHLWTGDECGAHDMARSLRPLLDEKVTISNEWRSGTCQNGRNQQKLFNVVLTWQKKHRFHQSHPHCIR